MEGRNDGWGRAFLEGIHGGCGGICLLAGCGRMLEKSDGFQGPRWASELRDIVVRCWC